MLDAPGKLARSTEPSPAAVVPLPQWCIDRAYTGLWAVRTAACEIRYIRIWTQQIVNGVPQTTGTAYLNLTNYTYTSEDLGVFAHQVQTQLVLAEGAASTISVQGDATSSDGCTKSFSAFPIQPIQPVGAFRSGDAQFNTWAALPGDIAECQTTWTLTFTNPGHIPSTVPVTMDEVRCDNVIGANRNRPRRVGCVIPWYASAVTYRFSMYPTLAAHVAQAQASGLPGNSFAAPLIKTSNPAIVNVNRNLACGDAPSIEGMNCDEYPLASTMQGLALGGTRRTFPGCNISAPSGTGPIGASACMISATDNFAQGGLMAGFYYDRRVLDGDPYRVLVAE